MGIISQTPASSPPSWHEKAMDQVTLGDVMDDELGLLPNGAPRPGRSVPSLDDQLVHLRKQAEFARLTAELAGGAPALQSLSTQALLDAWILESSPVWSRPTVLGYQSFARSFAVAFPSLPLVPADLYQWILSKKNPKTRDNCWRRVSAFLSYVERIHDVPHALAKLRKPPMQKKQQRSFTFDEARAVDAAVDSPEERLVVDLFLGIGRRLSDFYRVTSVRTGVLTLVATKEYAGETIPVTPGLESSLTKLVGITSPSRDTIGVRLKDLYARAGIEVGKDERIGAHVLRHTFTTLWDEAGGNPFAAERITGHSIVGSQMGSHYRHLSMDYLRGQLAAHGPLAFVRGGTTRD